MWLVYALISSFFFGIRGILYQWTSQRPIDRNLVLIGVYVTGTIVSLAMSFIIDQSWTAAAWVGILMGFFSFTANGAMYRAFAEGKTSVVAVFISLPPVVVVIIAYFLWNETLNLFQTAAFIVILSGIILIRYSNEISLHNLQGVHWALLAMLTFGFTDLSSKQAMLLEADIFPVLTVMYAIGTILFYTAWIKGRRAPVMNQPRIAMPLPWKRGKTFLWGMLVGLTNILGMIFILLSFSIGLTGLVSAVIALNVLYILFYARLFLKEKFSVKETIGIGLSIVGVIILHLTA
jgi:drug/metabolite transporter (DMT)-like permease